MSGLEILGAGAAGTQLVVYVIHIIEALVRLRDHIKHAPARFRSYIEQLESLSITIRSIQDSQGPLTVVFEKPLQAISKRVDTLNLLLEKSMRKVSLPATARYIRIFVEKRNERRIRESFAVLEGLKVNLGLCIAESNRKSLENLRVDLRARMSNVEVREMVKEEDSTSAKTEYTLNDESKEKNQLVLHTTSSEVVAVPVPVELPGSAPSPAQPEKAPVDPNATVSDKPETAKEGESTVREPKCIISGVDSCEHAIGGIGWGMSQGVIKDSKASKSWFGGIGPMSHEFLQILLQANVPSSPSNT